MSKRFNYAIQSSAGNIFSTSGNVGIGTTSPGERLTIIGNLQVGGNTQSNYISFYGTTGDNPSGFNHSYVGERIYGGAEKSELLLFKGNDHDSTSGPDRIRLLSAEHRFDTYTSSLWGSFDSVGTSGTTRMTILNNGNIGIGTTTPSNILDVVGDPIFDDLELYPNRTSNNSYPVLQLSSNQFTGQTTGTIYSKISTRSWKGPSSGEFANDDVWIQVERQNITNPSNNFTHDAGLVIYTNDNNRDNQPTKRITINQNGLIINSGNIGIGTTNPQHRLDVNGGINSTTFTTGNAQFMNANLTTSTIATLLNTNTVSTNISSGTLTLSTGITSANSRITGSLSALGNNHTIGSIITTGGNVGIGTSSPAHSLDVSGNMNFTGNLTKNGTSFDSNPTGTLLMWSTSSAPPGYLLCNGTDVSRTTYASLFAVIGTTYGVGNGSTTFTLPDFRGRTPIGSGQGSGLTNRTLGQTGGSETHTLTAQEMPTHTHTGTTNAGGSHNHTGTTDNNAMPLMNNGGWNLWNADRPAGPDLQDTQFGTYNHTHTFTTSTAPDHNHSFTTNAAGGGGAHNNMQPFLVINFIIKF